MKIQHEVSGREGRFFVQQDGAEDAELQYSLLDTSTICIFHTGVPEALRGKGLGRKLVNAAVEFARAKHFHIEPECPFAASLFANTREYADVLAR